MTPYGGMWISLGLGNGLLSDGTKSLPEPMLPIISEVLWHSPESNFTASAQTSILHDEFENCTFEITVTSPTSQWVNQIKILQLRLFVPYVSQGWDRFLDFIAHPRTHSGQDFWYKKPLSTFIYIRKYENIFIYGQFLTLKLHKRFKSDIVKDLWPFLLTWINLNPGMDKYLHPLWSVGWNDLSITKPQRLHRWILGMDT